MPISCVQPIIGKGPLHAGPPVVHALRNQNDKLGEGARRKRWNERHQVTWKNDYQNPNMRNYFGRRVEKPDIPVRPARRLRPTWVLDCPDEEQPSAPYRIFDSTNATFKEQWQWVQKQPDASSFPNGMPASATSGSIQSSQSQSTPSKPKRTRSPRRPEDLKLQRAKEAEWDRQHAVVFSRFNDGYQINTRSYFDRWKDDEDKAGANEKEPTWKLVLERRNALAKSSSEPLLGRSVLGAPISNETWVGNF